MFESAAFGQNSIPEQTSSTSGSDFLHHELAAGLISQEQSAVGREGADQGWSQTGVQSRNTLIANDSQEGSPET